MDDVSVSDGTTELLLNGGFESGSFSPGWTVSTPNGACGWFSTGAQISSSSCRTGFFCCIDGCGGCMDEVSQTFAAVAGKNYTISFWVTTAGGGSTIAMTAALS